MRTTTLGELTVSALPGRVPLAEDTVLYLARRTLP
jgi:hypothetical protein